MADQKQISSALISVFSKEGLDSIVKKIDALGIYHLFHRRHPELY